MRERSGSFVWMMKHNSLITNEGLHYKKLNEPHFSETLGIIEFILHVLRDSGIIKSLWIPFVNPNHEDNFLNTKLQGWIYCNLYNDLGHKDQENWQAKWATCYTAWYLRNQRERVDNFIKTIHTVDSIAFKVMNY